MDLDELNKSVSNNENNKFDINIFIKELEERLIEMEKEKFYTVDRFEGDIAVCEDRDTMEMINISKSELPSDIKEGSIVKYKDGNYSLDVEEQKRIEERIKEKMNNLWE